MTENEIKAAALREFAEYAEQFSQVLYTDLDRGKVIRVVDLARDFARRYE